MAMIEQQEIMNKLIEKGTQIWSNIESEKIKKVNTLRDITQRLSLLASPLEQNNVKVEIVRQTCKKLKERYPGYAKEIDDIVLPFEYKLRFNDIAILPFKQIDSLTYRIFINQNMMSFVRYKKGCEFDI